MYSDSKDVFAAMESKHTARVHAWHALHLELKRISILATVSLHELYGHCCPYLAANIGPNPLLAWMVSGLRCQSPDVLGTCITF